jgi:hypothetical protein
MWFIDLPPYRAKDPPHRPTGEPRGHPTYDDAGLADAVRLLQLVFGVDEETAVGEVARSLVVSSPTLPSATGTTLTSARKRVRRALRQAETAPIPTGGEAIDGGAG